MAMRGKASRNVIREEKTYRMLRNCNPVQFVSNPQPAGWCKCAHRVEAHVKNDITEVLTASSTQAISEFKCRGGLDGLCECIEFQEAT